MTSPHLGSLAPSIGLPYDVGNAGDLLKHGVLAEFAQWRCESCTSFRFIDLFGGLPWESPVAAVVKRLQALPDCALRRAQTGLDENRYYGSGFVARHVAESAGIERIRVLASDLDPARRAQLQAAGLAMVEEDFPSCAGQYDGYAALNEIAQCADDGDLVLVDPFADFLPRSARTVVPRLAELAGRAAVLVFVLNLDPGNRVGQRFDALLESHLPGALRLTCPPLPDQGVKGESKYHAEVVLAARALLPHGRSRQPSSAATLQTRLAVFAEHVAGVLQLPPQRLAPRVVGC